jgi:hypothetical protein
MVICIRRHTGGDVRFGERFVDIYTQLEPGTAHR